jgi:hypothetical protein
MSETHETDAKNKPQELDAEFDPEPPPWLQVEHDLYFPLTVPTISLGKVEIRVEEGKPSIFLPEDTTTNPLNNCPSVGTIASKGSQTVVSPCQETSRSVSATPPDRRRETRR